MLLGYLAGWTTRSSIRWSERAGAVKLDVAVEAVNDPELIELHLEHLGEGEFSPGSEERLSG